MPRPPPPRWPSTPLERTRIVLQLPFKLAPDLESWFLKRVRAARAQLARVGIQSACFWWTDHAPTPTRQRAVEGVARAVNRTCDGRLVTFHSDVYPRHRHVVDELETRAPGRYRRRPWWYFADAPFVLASRQLGRWLGSAAVVWYMEWDVAWTGDLGAIFAALSPPKNKYGLGLVSSHCRSCNDPAHARWQGCLLGNWSSFGEPSNPARNRTCSGTIQLLWYGRRLLDELHRKLAATAGDVMYCEAAAATACHASTWGCRVDSVAKRAPRGLFGKWSPNPWSDGNELIPPGNSVDRLFHPVKQPEWEGIVPPRLRHPKPGSRARAVAAAAALPGRARRRYGWQSESDAAPSGVAIRPIAIHTP